MKRIGILGGTFNPVHKGHLALAAAAREQFVLDEVVFVPSGSWFGSWAAGVPGRLE